ncbi:MAG: adenylate kinase [Bacilli bacterium]|nr:adenylate kinase [Bacilli bacterium]
MKNIIFIAPPGAGKGTQAKMVSEKYGIPHISTGDLLRDERNSGSELSEMLKQEMDKGNLIDDNIIVHLLRERLNKVDCNNGYILDGYPRSVLQSKIYEDLLLELNKEIGIVIYMDIDKDLALERTLSRLICSSCGASYSSASLELKPKIDGICDRCGHMLRVRGDDNPEVFSNRFDTYLRETKPLIDYYNSLGILKTITVLKNDTAQDVFNKIEQFLK